MDTEIPLPETPLAEADIAVARRMKDYQGTPVVKAMKAVSELSDQPPLLVGTAGVMVAGLLRRDQALLRRGAHLYASVVLATVMKGMLKHTVSRTRPFLLFKRGQHETRLNGPDDKAWHSFPSGHAAGAAALARSATRCWPQARLPAYAAAAAMSMSRVPPGSHYPSDVVAGVLVGIAAAAIVDKVLPPHGEEDVCPIPARRGSGS